MFSNYSIFIFVLVISSCGSKEADKDATTQPVPKEGHPTENPPLDADPNRQTQSLWGTWLSERYTCGNIDSMQGPEVSSVVYLDINKENFEMTASTEGPNKIFSGTTSAPINHQLIDGKWVPIEPISAELTRVYDPPISDEKSAMIAIMQGFNMLLVISDPEISFIFCNNEQGLTAKLRKISQ